MSHMVIYRGNDGKPGYHQTDDIHDAVGFVEQMRNEDGVEHARIFRLEEVVFEYKPYFRVQLSESMAPAANGNGAPVNGTPQVGSGDGGSTDVAPGDRGPGGTGATEEVAGGPKGESPNGEPIKGEPTGGDDADAESADGADVKTVAGAKKGLFGR